MALRWSHWRFSAWPVAAGNLQLIRKVGEPTVHFPSGRWHLGLGRPSPCSQSCQHQTHQIANKNSRWEQLPASADSLHRWANAVRHAPAGRGVSAAIFSKGAEVEPTGPSTCTWLGRGSQMITLCIRSMSSGSSGKMGALLGYFCDSMMAILQKQLQALCQELQHRCFKTTILHYIYLHIITHSIYLSTKTTVQYLLFYVHVY